MSRPDRLNSLLEQWETERSKGHQLSADELCRDCPELRNAVESQIRIRLSAGNQRPPAEAIPTTEFRGSSVQRADRSGGEKSRSKVTERLHPPADTDASVDYATRAPGDYGPKDTEPPSTNLSASTNFATQAPGQSPSAHSLFAGVVKEHTRDTMPSEGELVAGGGGYKKLKRLGHGTFGEVWMAEAPGGVRVALKMLSRPVDHEEGQRELQSLELICGLRHPFLLQTQAYWTVEDRLYIAMELADGTLRDRLKECRKAGLDAIPYDELIEYTRHAAEALDFLHTKRVQHRDIKPENILVMGKFAKVADFGLARSQGSRQFASMTVGGTPVYMAPEVWSGRVSDHTDQYALVMTYAELRMGRRVFSGNDLVSLMHHHLGSDPQFDPLPKEEQAVLQRGMAKDPEKRYPSCRAFVDALAEACRPKPAPPPPPPPPPSRRWPVVLLMLLLIGAGAFGVTQWPPGSIETGTFQLDAPAPLLLFPGEKRTGIVPLRRDRLAGAIRLQARTDESSRVHVEVSGDATEENLPFTVTAADDAPWGTYAITLDADAGGQHREVVLPVHVLYRPSADWQRVGETQQKDSEGHWFAERLRRQVGDQAAEMILIPHSTPQTENEPEVPTYYLMETKVTVGMFRAFAEQHKVTSNAWQKSTDEKCPVFNVFVIDAYGFARWLGGNLPTVDQWDKAAGRYRKDRGEGPFRGKWDAKERLDIAVGLQEPKPAGTAKDDISWCQCRDMAGNGFEWMRNLDGDTHRFVPVAKPTSNDNVKLRGKSFSMQEPFKFTNPSGGICEYAKTREFLGFRVAWEPGLSPHR